jgi:hypothetical protein
MSRTLRPHTLHYRRRGAAVDRLNRQGHLFTTWLISRYSQLQTQINEIAALRRLVLALIIVVCVSLVVLTFTLYAANRREQTDAEIWQNAIIYKNSETREIPDIQKMPERRYVNEQI